MPNSQTNTSVHTCSGTTTGIHSSDGAQAAITTLAPTRAPSRPRPAPGHPEHEGCLTHNARGGPGACGPDTYATLARGAGVPGGGDLWPRGLQHPGGHVVQRRAAALHQRADAGRGRGRSGGGVVLGAVQKGGCAVPAALNAHMAARMRACTDG